MPELNAALLPAENTKKLLAQAAGFRGRRKNVYRVAKQAVMRADQYAYRDRKRRKRDFRSLWIVRINAAARQCGMTYSQFMGGLRRAGIALNRKSLANIAADGEISFKELAALAQKHA